MPRRDHPSGVARIRPRARVIHTLGDELISDDTVALTELVKNAYDADADGVLIDLTRITSDEDSLIVVADNGCGMTLQTVLSAWMEPATFEKTRQRTTGRGRRLLGEKGIGRFATSRLGRILEMVTRSKSSESEIRVTFDWSQFDAEDAYLDQVEVQWEERAPSDDLRSLTLHVLSELEKRRYKEKPREVPRAIEGGLLEGMDLKPIRSLVREKFPDEPELKKVVNERERFLASRVRAIKEVLARYRRHATLGQLIDVILHDGRTPIAKIENEAELGKRDAAKLAANSIKPEKIRDRFALIGNQAGVVSSLFQKLEPFGGRRRGRPAAHSVEELITNTFAIFEGSIGDLHVRTSLPRGETMIVCEPSDVQQIIANLLDNSLYWLQKVAKNRREILVEVERPSPEVVSIIFCDSGPGVEEEFQQHIFEPYFTTKTEGVGLGLTIAGEIAVEYGGTLELLGNGPLRGACFRATLRSGGSHA